MTSSATLRVPAVGEVAPDFTLRATDGTSVTLSDLRGQRNVLLAFFPAAFTSTCTKEMCSFRDDYEAFEGRDVVVYPVSVDNVPSLREYRAKYELPVTLLSDLGRQASTAYGVLLPTFVSNRAYFLIDKAGILRYAHVEEHPGHRRENAELLAEIAKLA